MIKVNTNLADAINKNDYKSIALIIMRILFCKEMQVYQQKKLYILPMKQMQLLLQLQNQINKIQSCSIWNSFIQLLILMNFVIMNYQQNILLMLSSAMNDFYETL